MVSNARADARMPASLGVFAFIRRQHLARVCVLGVGAALGACMSAAATFAAPCFSSPPDRRRAHEHAQRVAFEERIHEGYRRPPMLHNSCTNNSFL